LEIPLPADRLTHDDSMQMSNVFERRVDVLEGAIDGYVEHRAKQALDRSRIAGLEDENHHNRSNSGTSNTGGKS
jgi:hypothetical protein